MKKSKTFFIFLCILGGGIFAGFIVADHIQEGRLINYDAPPVHASYVGGRNLIEEAFAKGVATTTHTGVKGLIINHHLFAPHVMARVLQSVGNRDVKVIFLLSPNHFGLGKSSAITSAYDWQTPYGVMLGGPGLLNNLIKEGLVSIEEEPFRKEHGVSAVIPFLKRAFPKAGVVPIIIKDSMTEQEVESLARALHGAIPEHALIVGSFDFSHYLPHPIARFHDEKSIEAFTQFDRSSLSSLDIDSLPGARLFLALMEMRGAQNTVFVDHTSSAELAGDQYTFENTSYITMLFKRGEMTRSKKATVLAFGDMMLDRAVRKKMLEEGDDYPWREIKRMFMGNDIVFANLEGPITPNPSKTIDFRNKTLQFTFATTTAPALKKAGFTLFSLANNHSDNFGREGLAYTRSILKMNSIGHFGDPQNTENVSTTTSIRGITIGFVGFHEFSSSGYPRILAEISRLRKEVDFLIVAPHWGSEYNLGITDAQRTYARGFIDRGADLVLGAHPHVVEPIEIYKGKTIFYSLGNFIFDQDFSYDTTHGLSVGIVIEPEQTTYHLFPMKIADSKASIATLTERTKMLKELSTRSWVPESTRSDIIKGTFIVK